MQRHFRVQQYCVTATPDISTLLKAWRSGDNTAFGALVELLYEDVRSLARRQFLAERPGHTLQATAVANEALLRVAQADISFEDRGHFMAVVATTVRRVLVDHARSKARARRGGELLCVTLATEVEEPLADSSLVALGEAMDRLQSQDPRKARLIDGHYFGGLSDAELASAEEISEATVHRELRFARAWLQTQLTAVSA